MFGLRFYLSTLSIVGFWLFSLCMSLWIFLFIVFHFMDSSAHCDLSWFFVLFGLPTTRL